MKKFGLSSLPYKKQKKIISILFLFLPVALLLAFTYLPAFEMLRYSFTDWDGISKDINYVGFDNYKKIFAHGDEYFQPLIVSLYYLAASFIQLGLALVIAAILTSKVKLSNLFKGIYFFPSLINSVAIGFVFLFFFQPGGTLDGFLNAIGLGDHIQFWLRDSSIANVSLAYTSIWRFIGFNIVMFTAAIQSISTDIFEAAAIDGATAIHKFFYIIIPNISAILGINLFLAVSGSLTVFEIPYIMTGGGNGTMSFVIQTVNVAFQNHRVGIASALGVVLFILIITVTILQKLVFREKKLSKGDKAV